MTTIVFHGTKEETADLLKALQANCSCEYGPFGKRLSLCPPHSILTDKNGQRIVDDLLFHRRIRERLMKEEFGEEGASGHPLFPLPAD